MRTILILLFALFFSLSAENGFDDNENITVSQHILYSSYEDYPKSVFKGQIFSITIKTLSTQEEFEEISYRFDGGYGVRLLNEKPFTKEKNHYYYHTFYFSAISTSIKTPDIIISLIYNRYIQDELVYLKGKKIKAIKLNPPKDFVNIIANDLKLTQYKTNEYNDRENIAVFSMEANHTTIENFKIPQDYIQGFESNISTIWQSNITYYAIFPKHLEQLEFSYFHLPSRKFKKLIMPIILDDDSVSTQSNLTPRDQRHTQIKLYISLSVALIALVLFILRKRYFYLFIIIFTTIYALYIAIPIQDACVKAGSPIYLLPMNNGTIFELTEKEKIFQIEGSIDGYIKIKLHNNKIGWIRNEALCTH
jgi:hypothetical protein